jgi:hypothetical protein
MKAVLASTITSSSSYFGPLDFLDSQLAFDTTFLHPVPLLVTLSSATSVSIDSVTALLAIHKFVDQCKFLLFLPIFGSEYVGTADRDDAGSLHATIQALK